MNGFQPESGQGTNLSQQTSSGTHLQNNIFQAHDPTVPTFYVPNIEAITKDSYETSNVPSYSSRAHNNDHVFQIESNNQQSGSNLAYGLPIQPITSHHQTNPLGSFINSQPGIVYRPPVTRVPNLSNVRNYVEYPMRRPRARLPSHINNQNQHHNNLQIQQRIQLSQTLFQRLNQVLSQSQSQSQVQLGIAPQIQSQALSQAQPPAHATTHATVQPQNNIQYLSTNQQNTQFRDEQFYQLFPDFIAKEDILGGLAGPQQTNPVQSTYVDPRIKEKQTEEEDNYVEAHDDELQQAETYAEYMPSKLTVGLRHPDPVVETSSLATVMPPDIHYELVLPQKIIDEGLLSALQLETVVYASQQHQRILPDRTTRAGFLIGDGAGVGKGRTIAGIIYENYLRGRKKSIWLSVSNDLKLDAERDLRDIGAEKIPVHLLGKFPYGRRLDSNVKGGFVLFSTYQGLISESTSIRGSLGSRIGQIINWVGDKFDGVVIFDECHKAKNISVVGKGKPSKTAQYALDIQKRLPNARVVYASATGASETRNMGYMTRLGIWGLGTPFSTFNEFCSSIERRGVGAMELVAIDLKMKGAYMARQLSFKGTSFNIEKVKLSNQYKKIYDESVDLWVDAKDKFQRALLLFKADNKMSRQVWTQFWASHQRYFKYLCIGAKVPFVVQTTKEALKQGKSVVIGLQATGEAKTLEALEECGELTDFISTARAVFESLVENNFPAPQTSRKSTSPISRKLLSRISRRPTQPIDDDLAIDESWHDHKNIRFTIENGLVTAKLSPREANASGLYELATAKKNLKTNDRGMRAKRRAAIKSSKQSRIAMRIQHDSDTEASSSNPSSSSLSSVHSLGSFIVSDDSDQSEESEPSDSEIESNSESELDSDTDSEESELSWSKKKRKRKNNPWQVRRAENKKRIAEREKRDKAKRNTKNTPTKKRLIESDSDSDATVADSIDRPAGQKSSVEVVDISDHDEDRTVANNFNDDCFIQEDPSVFIEMKKSLLKRLDKLAPGLPNNTLDDLINQLGGPSKVAEMTGRKGRVVASEDGSVSYECRNETEVSLELLNVAEKARFMNDEKRVAIISEAASSGISLHADRRAKNQRRRVHITIELPWSADRAIQQFGRTHRSNQTSAPEYIFLISDLAGEQRFASIVAKRLESLGALTHGDRRATTESRDLSQFNILTKYGREALDIVLKSVVFQSPQRTGVNLPDYIEGRNFLRDTKDALIGCGLASHGRSFYGSTALEKDACNTTKFLNRLLGMKVEIQNALFKYFMDTMDSVIARAKRMGNYDSGIIELNSDLGKVKCSEHIRYELASSSGPVHCELLTVLVERGISWKEILQIYNNEQKYQEEGFYTVFNDTIKSTYILLALSEASSSSTKKYRIYKPNSGISNKCELMSSIKARGRKVTLEEAEPIWTRIYEATDTQCSHMCFFNKCTRTSSGIKCDVGLRHRKYCILSGGVLTAWPYLERRAPHITSKLNIVRLKTSEGMKLIGPSIPLNLIGEVKDFLKEGVEKGVNF